MKSKHKFAVGDRVIYHANVSGNGWLNGMEGRIIYVDGTRCHYTVQFDVPIAEGNTDYRARKNGIEPDPWCGWFCREENLTLIEM